MHRLGKRLERLVLQSKVNQIGTIERVRIMRILLVALLALFLWPASLSAEDGYVIYSEEVYMGRTVNDGLDYYVDNHSDSSLCLEPFIVESHNVAGEWVSDIIVVPPHAKHLLIGSFHRVSLEEEAYIHADADAVANCS